MVDPVFEISPFGDKWAVTSDEQVLMVTRTKPEARKLAREAEKVLAPTNRPDAASGAGRDFEEPRSFAPSQDGSNARE